MKYDEIATAGGNVFTYILASIQSNQIMQTIELILAITTSVVILVYRIWKWWKEAKKDGKITKEEIKDGVDIIMGGINDIKDKKKGEKKDEDNQSND